MDILNELPQGACNLTSHYITIQLTYHFGWFAEKHQLVLVTI